MVGPPYSSHSNRVPTPLNLTFKDSFSVISEITFEMGLVKVKTDKMNISISCRLILLQYQSNKLNINYLLGLRTVCPTAEYQIDLN